MGRRDQRKAPDGTGIEGERVPGLAWPPLGPPEVPFAMIGRGEDPLLDAHATLSLHPPEYLWTHFHASWGHPLRKIRQLLTPD